MPELTTSSIHPTSRPSTIPPELLARVVSFVGNDKLLLGDNGRDINVPGRREEIQHLAACTLVCVYWAKVARPRMLRMLVLRSIKDIHGLRDYFNSSNTVLSIHDIPSIARCLRILVIEYRLGDWAWFHNVQGLANARDEYQTLYSSTTPLSAFHLQINVSSTPISMESTGRVGFRSARHPLFFATPKPIPMPCSSAFDTTSITLKDIHFTEFRTLQNLVQDFNLFRRTLTADRRPRRSRDRYYAHRIDCRNVTWELDGMAPTPIPYDTAFKLKPLPPRGQLEGPPLLDGPAVAIRECSDSIPAALACATGAYAVYRIPYIHIRDRHVITQVVHGLCSAATSSLIPEGDAAHEDLQGSYHYQRYMPSVSLSEIPADPNTLFDWLTLSTEFDLTITAQSCRLAFCFQTVTHARGRHRQEHTHDIDTISIHLPCDHASGRRPQGGTPIHTQLLQAYNWNAIFTALATFPHLSRIDVRYCQFHFPVVSFATQLKEVPSAIEDILVFSYNEIILDPDDYEAEGPLREYTLKSLARLAT